MVPAATGLVFGTLASRYYAVNGQEQDEHFELLKSILEENTMGEIESLQEVVQSRHICSKKPYVFEFLEPEAYDSNLTLKKRRKVDFENRGNLEDFSPPFFSLNSLSLKQESEVLVFSCI
jgi:hypothetical protein